MEKSPSFWLKISLLRQLLEVGVLHTAQAPLETLPRFRDLLSLPTQPWPHLTCPIKTANASQEAKPSPPSSGMDQASWVCSRVDFHHTQ